MIGTDDFLMREFVRCQQSHFLDELTQLSHPWANVESIWGEGEFNRKIQQKDNSFEEFR